MSLLVIVAAALAGLVIGCAALHTVIRIAGKHEPYASFLRLRTRQKIRFFRLLATDSRVPRRAKWLPVLILPYLALPFDIIPDFIPVLGYLDDVAIVLGAFALIIRWTPRTVIEDLFLLAAAP